MNTLLLIMLGLIEIGLLAITFSENREKKVWSRNRLLASILEALAFLVFSFFPGIDYSIRFKGLIGILLMRILLGGIGYLRRRNAQGSISGFRVVTSAILSMVILVMSSLPSYLIADYKGLTPSGSYQVAKANAILVDGSREETFETDGSFREIPVDFYYPKTEGDETFPLVIFSHGAFGYSKSNYSLYQELASNGYVVVSLSHPYHAFFCKDTSGKIITVNQEFLNSAFYINEGTASEKEIYALTSEWIKLRTEDVNFVVDTLKQWNPGNAFSDAWYLDGADASVEAALSRTDFNKIAVMGHSLGGAAAVNVGRLRDDVSAVVDLDGSMIGEELDLIPCESFEFEGRTYTDKYLLNENPYPVPILNIDNEEHHNSRVTAKSIGMPYANNEVMDHAICGYDTYFVGAGHMNLTDLPLYSPFLAKMLGTGSIDSKECIEEINHLVLSFLDDTLKGRGEFVIEEAYGD